MSALGATALRVCGWPEGLGMCPVRGDIGHGASSVGAWNSECWRGCAEQDRIPGTFVTRGRGAILNGGWLRKDPLEQLPCDAHVAPPAAPQGRLSARKPVAEGPRRMQGIESNLHLFQPPRY